MPQKQYCVYILTNVNHSVLYTGVPNDFRRRVLEHRAGKGSAFTSRYKITRLVYFECGDNVETESFREKRIKAGQTEVVTEPSPEESARPRKGEVIDLMALLKKSVESKGKARRPAAPAKARGRKSGRRAA